MASRAIVHFVIQQSRPWGYSLFGDFFENRRTTKKARPRNDGGVPLVNSNDVLIYLLQRTSDALPFQAPAFATRLLDVLIGFGATDGF